METRPILLDLHLQPKDLNWVQIWQATPNIVGLETNYKVLTRWYLVPAKIAKVSPQYSSHCFHGSNTTGTQAHTWWECPIVSSFWMEVFKIISTLFSTPLTH